MNRLFALSYGAAAFAAGMMLVHCSGSSSTGTISIDAGKGDTGHTTTSGPDSGKDSGTTTPHDATPGSGSGSDSGTVAVKDSGAVKDTGTTPTKDSGLTDTHDAGPCIGPAGGAACDPGNVECNNMQCKVPGNVCCEDGTTPACVGVTATCGNPQTCDEKSDCPDGQICCLAATSFTASSITCQNGPTCPSSLGSAQICKTNAECGAGGTCSLYSCEGQIAEACQAPNAICTKM